MPVKTIDWDGERLRIIDQTLLPAEFKEIPLDTVDDVWQAIKQLKVRGAPAIGIAAAFGILVALNEKAPKTVEDARRIAENAAAHLATSRPTAVNLFWALERMRVAATAISEDASLDAFREALAREAVLVWEEDQRLCRAIGRHGASLIAPGAGVLTHCNAGGLATADYGTALALMFTAHENGVPFRVFADETRPLLQGARLTAWELQQAGIDVTLICDNMAGQVMREGRIDMVVVGADRIAANGDTANKIGTYSVAVLAKAHNIPFYVAAPTSTFDLSLETGASIPIEERDGAEIARGFGAQTAPDGIQIYNPAFDVTPHTYIAGIITEKGILEAPFANSIAATVRGAETRPLGVG